MKKATLMVAVAAASWGTWSLFLFPTGLPAQATMPIIFLVMGVSSLAYVRDESFAGATWDRQTYWLLAANTIFDAGNGVCFFSAYDHTTIAIAVLTHYAAPIVIALAAPYVDGVTIRGTRLAAVVALGGLVIVLEPWRSGGALLGAALGFASALFYAGNVFSVRRLAARIGAARAMAYHSLLAAVITAPLGIAWYGRATPSALALLALGGIVVGTGAGIAFVTGLGRIGSARAAVLTFAEPLVAVAVGALVWGQQLHPIAALGGALVLAAGLHVARQAR